MNKSQVLSEYYFKKIHAIDKNNNSLEEKFNQYNRLFEQILNGLTFDLDIHFSSQFSKMAYVFQETQPSTALRRQVHQLWKHKNNMAPKTPEDIQKMIQVLTLAVAHFFHESLPDWLKDIYPTIEEVDQAWSNEPELEQLEFLRIVVKHYDSNQNQFVGMSMEEGRMVRVDCSSAEIQGYYPAQVKFILQQLQAPYFLQLIKVQHTEEDLLIPQAYVIEPDYLFDVTAVAECFKPEMNSHYFHLLRKLTPFKSNVNLVIGNTANFFLDELMEDDQISYQELMQKVFQIYPLTFCSLKPEEATKFFTDTLNHYRHLKHIVKEIFPKNGIIPKESQLEPTFYSANYGLQGRLDVFHTNLSEASIVELKSGRPYRTNKYQININHYTQTLLYDLLIRSAFDGKLDPKNYVLYSKEDDKNLRFAPAIPSIQYEALQMRNLLFGLERLLADSLAQDIFQSNTAKLIRKLDIKHFPAIKGGYVLEDIRTFREHFLNSTPIEQKYFIAFCGFIARENMRAKMGIASSEKNRGQARLWTLGELEKNQAFMLLNKLELEQVDNSGKNTILHFKKSAGTNPLANFRIGDIIVLYPNGQRPTGQQLFKASLLAIDQNSVQVRLRNKQHNTATFSSNAFWNAEHDHIDSGFNQMYGSIAELIAAPSNKKALILGTRPPEEKPTYNQTFDYPLTAQQQELLNQMLSKQEFFLLWGPPGTGKTSRMLRYFVQWILEHTSENILLLSYTNRAVDEICAAVYEIGPNAKQQLMRIGSTTSASTEFTTAFLNEKIKGLNDRKQVKALLLKQRVVVSTVSSLLNNQEILDLMDFDRVLIDEASQIPEPMLVGLMVKLKHPILIGDHKQLPAVVVQNEKYSAVDDEDLASVGLKNMRNSFFERMYKLAVQNQWSHVLGQLSFQGRMHQQIMQFPAKHFYDGHLNILSIEADPSQSQQAPLQWTTKNNSEDLEQQLRTKRLLFLPTAINELEPWAKLNQDEAEQTADVINCLISMYQEHGMEMNPDRIGVITPFRAQIAQIRQCLYDRALPVDLITIDTVERYQGGARDVIILSTCANNLEQIESICSLSDEGIDRKLNVAITRARDQFILIGNEELLSTTSGYQNLIQYIKEC